MVVPETISPVPAGFTPVTGFLVPDPSAQRVWNVSLAGTVAPFAHTDLGTFDGRPGLERVLGGLFSTNSTYLTTGYFLYSDPTGGSAGLIYTYDSAGSRTLFLQGDGTNGLSLLTTPTIAPSSFGSYGGDLVVTDQNGFVFAVDLSTKDVVELYDHNDMTSSGKPQLDFNPFGLAFAPTGFGAVEGKLLLGENNDGRHAGYVNLFTLSADSKEPTLFTSVPLLAGQRGLRQMAFAPASFLEDEIPGLTGDLLFVAMSGSTRGGGTQGDVLAIDASGNIVASLRTIDDLVKFDPRGLYFEGETLYVSDASDPIITAAATDFRPGRYGNVPEPATLALLAIGLAAVGAMRRKTQAA
jgi:hypothetical protein